MLATTAHIPLFRNTHLAGNALVELFFAPDTVCSEVVSVKVAALPDRAGSQLSCKPGQTGAS